MHRLVCAKMCNTKQSLVNLKLGDSVGEQEVVVLVFPFSDFRRERINSLRHGHLCKTNTQIFNNEYIRYELQVYKTTHHVRLWLF